MFSFLPTNRLYRHGLFWVGVALYFWLPQLIYPDYLNTVSHYFFGFDYARSPYFLPILFGYALGVGIIYTYAFLRWVMPPLLTGRYGRGISRYALLTVSICYGFRLLKALHMAALDPWLRHQSVQPVDGRHFGDLFINQVYIHEYTTIILIVAMAKFFVNWQHKQQEAARLTQAKLRTEIQLVKARINPRFMVSSLDTVHVLIERHAQQAPTVVLALSHFLSYVLYESEADVVPLERDLDAMQRYMALEKERLGDRIDISVNLTGDIPRQVIAPLLFLPFLENAFQHGLTTTDQAWLSLNVSVTEHLLTFSLANSVEPAQEGIFSQKTGLNAIRKRLDTLYADRYELKLEPDFGVFVVVLTLQLGLTRVPQNAAPPNDVTSAQLALPTA
ncbi:sensor histidine kinase [Spirosoma arcticum]